MSILILVVKWFSRKRTPEVSRIRISAIEDAKLKQTL